MKISIKAARVNANLTQVELAEKMDKSESTIKNWESGKNVINILDFKELCKVLGVQEDQIFLPYKSS